MRVKKKTLYLMILLFVLVEPPFFSTIAIVHSFYNYAQYLCFVVMLFYIATNRRWLWIVKKPERYYMCFFLIVFAASMINNRNPAFLQYTLSSYKAIIALVLLCVIEKNKNEECLLRCLRNLDIYVYINLISIMLFPNGLYISGNYMCWFLGYKNPQIRLILPVLFFSLLCDLRVRGKISLRSVLVMVCSILSTILTKSGTGLTGLGVFLIVLFVGINWKKVYEYFLSFKIIVMTIVILVFAFVVYQVQFRNAFISNVIVNYYGKTLDFSARTIIWDRALELIKLKPFMGYGFMDSSMYANLFGFSWSAAHPHNYYLYLLMTGGAALLATFVIILLNFIRILKKEGYSKYAVCCVAFLSSLLVMGITESLTEFVLLYASMYLACITVCQTSREHSCNSEITPIE